MLTASRHIDSASTISDPTGGRGLRCWCGRNDWIVCFRAPRFGVLRCPGCGTYRTDPPPLNTASESEEFYTGYYQSVGTDARPVEDPATSRSAGFWKVADQAPVLQVVRRSVADIGCGDGHFCAELQGRGWPSVTGVDISHSRVARARKLYPSVRFHDGTLRDAGVARGSLDLIVMEAVIEHLPDPVGFLEEVKASLVPGGLLVMTTPNMDSGHFRFLGKRWTGMLAPHAHIFLFSPLSIARLVERAGLRTYQTGSYHTPIYTLVEYAKRLGRGDVKGTIWRAHQEIGGLYGRLINSGPMLYVVAEKIA